MHYHRSIGWFGEQKKAQVSTRNINMYDHDIVDMPRLSVTNNQSIRYYCSEGKMMFCAGREIIPISYTRMWGARVHRIPNVSRTEGMLP